MDETGTETGTAEVDTGGAVSGEDSEQEQSQEQGQEQGQQGQGQPGAVGLDGQPVSAGGPPKMVPYDRLQEATGKATTLEQENKFWREQAMRTQQGPQGQQRGWEVPKELQEIDTTLSPYMRHYLTPFAQHAQRMDQQVTDLKDGLAFFMGNRDVSPEQFKLIESTREALQQRTGHSFSREDTMTYLRGHKDHAAMFAPKPDPAQRVQALDRQTVSARRGAANVGGRQAIPGTTGSGEPDVAKMSPKDRVKYMESKMADRPF